jgi:hypothetical protein
MDHDELEVALHDSDVCILLVGLENARGVDPHEILTYIEIPEDAVGSNHHPLSVWTCSDVFDAAGFSDDIKPVAYEMGQKVYTRLVALVAALEPSYAAITAESPLRCPMELEQYRDSGSFRNFYMSTRFIGEQGINTIRQLYQDAYVETVGKGIYVSSLDFFNPDHVTVPVKLASSKSQLVSGIVGAQSRDRQMADERL